MSNIHHTIHLIHGSSHAVGKEFQHNPIGATLGTIAGVTAVLPILTTAAAIPILGPFVISHAAPLAVGIIATASITGGEIENKLKGH